MLSCPMCTGFWVGIFLWSVKNNTQLFTFDDSYISAFLLGCASSAAAYVGNVLFGDEGLKVEQIIHTKGVKNETDN